LPIRKKKEFGKRGVRLPSGRASVSRPTILRSKKGDSVKEERCVTHKKKKKVRGVRGKKGKKKFIVGQGEIKKEQGGGNGQKTLGK